MHEAVLSFAAGALLATGGSDSIDGIVALTSLTPSLPHTLRYTNACKSLAAPQTASPSAALVALSDLIYVRLPQKLYGPLVESIKVLLSGIRISLCSYTVVYLC